jgi:protein TonB
MRLTTLCQEAQDERRARRMAWAVSICALFLAVGLLGLRHPTRPAPRIVSAAQFSPMTLFEPPHAPEPEAATSESDPGLVEISVTPPPQHMLVAAVDSPEVAFPVPVPVSAVLVPARQAMPPAPVAPASVSSNTAFTPGGDGGWTPQPKYPRLAEQRGYEGTVIITFTADTSGEITEARVSKSSGFEVLDDEALNTIRRKWRLVPGPVRRHYIAIVFQLK